MPEANITSSMFEPQVFQAMVEALEPARGLTLYNSVKKDTTVYPLLTWTQKKGRVSELAEFNVPNAKANLIERGPSGTAERQATLAYMREGDYFTPTATMLLKDIEAGKTNPAAIQSMESIVADQVKTVNDRIDSRVEWMLWQAIQGGINYTGKNTGPISVDYGFQASHKVTLSSADQWDQTPSLESLISSIRNMKQTIRKDSGVDVDEVYLTTATFDLLIETWRKAAMTAAANTTGVLTEAQLNEYYNTGAISNTNFMGISSWKAVDQYYDVRNADGQTFQVKPYLQHGTVVFMNRNANNALKYTSGPSMDFDAPAGKTGRFAKNWTSQDPSGRQFLIEEHGLPVLNAPDQFGTLKVASQTWVDAQTW